jgi:hypothetical protein
MEMRMRRSAGCCRRIDLFHLDHARMNVPVVDAFQPREALFCRLDRSFRAAGRADDDRALAAAKQLAAAGISLMKQMR